MAKIPNPRSVRYKTLQNGKASYLFWQGKQIGWAVSCSRVSFSGPQFQALEGETIASRFSIDGYLLNPAN